MRNLSGSVFVAALAALLLAQAVRAAEPVPTTITVEGMHCAGCAKKVATKLTEVPGVAAAQGDIATSLLTVTAKAGQSPSPRALWEAVEKSGYKPTRIEGPGGTFTAKPQS